MWNYNLILPECVIIGTFLIFYFTQPRLPIKINRAFIYIIVIDLLTLLIDVVSSYCLEHFSHLDPCILRIQNIVFFILFLQRIFCFLMFTTIIVKKDIRTSKKEILIFLIPTIAAHIFVLLNFFFETIFRISESGKYSQGPLYCLIYVCAYYYVILSIIYVIRYRKNISTGEFIFCLGYNIVLLIGYTLRIVYPRYLIMNFFTLVSIIVIYLAFENPALFIEEKSGAFNRKALMHLFMEMKAGKYPLILGFTIHNYGELRDIYSNNQTDKGLSLIGSFLKQTFPKLMIFYLRDGRFVLVGKDYSQAEEIKNKIQTRFDSAWNTGEDIDLFLEISFAQLNPETISCDRDLLFTTMLTSLTDIQSKNQAELNVTIEQVEQIELNKHIKRAVELAVEGNSLELYLQPVVDAGSQKLTGAEALARIRDSNGEIIPPSQFIPIAEKNGRINRLGEQMFEKTCQFLHDNDIKTMGLSWVNVNLSPIQFLRRDLCETFTKILKKYDIPAEKIHLEITEESMIDYELLQKQMEAMKAAGFCFALDDYGRGYSNIARMKKCPFINVKLDMEFVWDFFKEKDKILPTLVQTIKQMGFTVTAEGIESLELADTMRDIGCDYLQGFVFSKPIPANEFAGKYGKN